MNRFDSWDDDGEEFAGQYALQMANEERSLKGKRGQASLRALEAALLALPEKRLIAGAVVDRRGGVCAMGALARHQGKSLPQPSEDEDCEDYYSHTDKIAKECGVPAPVAIKVAWLNDNGFGQLCYSSADPMTPEQRYERMLDWVRKNLIRDGQ